MNHMMNDRIRRYIPRCLLHTGRAILRDGKYALRYPRFLRVQPAFTPRVHAERKGEDTTIAPFLVGTSSGLLLYERGAFIRVCGGKIYGITLDEKGACCIFQRLPESFGRLVRFDLNTGQARTLADFLSTGIHQIDWVDSRLAVTDTYRNAIRLYSPRGRLLEVHHPNGRLPDGRNSDNYRHFNSVFRSGQDIYLVAHNWSQKTGRFSQIYRLDRNWKVREVLSTRSRSAHNVVCLDGEMWHCGSLDGTLVRGRRTVFRDERYFTRGLAVNHEHILLGGSEFAERENRSTSSAVVMVLNGEGKEMLRYRLIGCGDVFEIRFLQNDLALSGQGDVFA